jgi:hypothetical protein
MSTPDREDAGQLDLFGPPAGGWWYADLGSAQVYVIADDAGDAQRKAEAELRGMGVLPGGRRGCTRVGGGCASSPVAAGAERRAGGRRLPTFARLRRAHGRHPPAGPAGIEKEEP